MTETGIEIIGARRERRNRLGVALEEIGKVERTLFMLDWRENPALRRRCQAGLNNGERHVCTFHAVIPRSQRLVPPARTNRPWAFHREPSL